MAAAAILNQQFLSAQSMTSTFTTTVPMKPNDLKASIQFNWASGSSPVGTIQVQASDDNVNWANYGASQSVSGNSGTILFSIPDVTFKYAQIVYTATSGTATASATYVAKRW